MAKRKNTMPEESGATVAAAAAPPAVNSKALASAVKEAFSTNDYLTKIMHEYAEREPTTACAFQGNTAGWMKLADNLTNSLPTTNVVVDENGVTLASLDLSKSTHIHIMVPAEEMPEGTFIKQSKQQRIGISLESFTSSLKTLSGPDFAFIHKRPQSIVLMSASDDFVDEIELRCIDEDPSASNKMASMDWDATMVVPGSFIKGVFASGKQIQLPRVEITAVADTNAPPQFRFFGEGPERIDGFRRHARNPSTMAGSNSTAAVVQGEGEASTGVSLVPNSMSQRIKTTNTLGTNISKTHITRYMDTFLKCAGNSDLVTISLAAEADFTKIEYVIGGNIHCTFHVSTAVDPDEEDAQEGAMDEDDE